MKHDLVLFDFDGTLADSLPWFGGAMQRLAAEFGFKQLSAEEMNRFRNCSTSEILKAFNIPFWKMARIAAAARRMMSEEIDRISLFEGIDSFLSRLTERGVRLGIVSSNAKSNVLPVLGSEVAARFCCFECGVSLLGKATKLRRAARAAEVAITRALYVGDELRDLEAAGKARMAFGAVTWGCSDAPTFKARKPQAVFHSISEMESYLLGD